MLFTGTMPDGFFAGVWYLLQTKWSVFLAGVLTTLSIALIGTFVGFILGLGLASLRLLPSSTTDRPLYRVLRQGADKLSHAYIQLFRGTPMIVQATVIYYGVANLIGYWSAFFAGMVVVSLNTAAYLAEIIRGSVNALDRGQYEAGLAIGMTYPQIMWHILLPQAIRHAIPAIGNEFIVNIKDTAVLSVIAVADLFYSGKFIITASYRQFEVYFIISIIYLVMTLSASALLKRFESSLHVKSNVSIPTGQTDFSSNEGVEDDEQ